MASCPVCCETYNKTLHSKVICEYSDCNYEACKTCVRHYITTTNAEPHCMNCRKAMSIKFMSHQLNKSYIKNDYKVHRKSLLLERIMSQIPEAMPDVIRARKIIVKQDELVKATEAMNALIDRVKQIKNEISDLKMKKKDEETRKFIMGCPVDTCRGFLSSAYKCGLCEHYTCSKCLCVKGATQNSPHTCLPDNVASAELIKSQTNPCPSCGERISKVEGCDQMWCITCHTAFSWKTGKIDKGVVHNPHFFQYQKNGPIPHIALGQCNTENLPNYQIVSNIIRRLEKHQSMLANELTNVFRTIAHVHHDEIPIHERQLQYLENTTPLKVNYVLGKINKEELSSKLYTDDCKRVYKIYIMNVLALLDQIGRELIWGIVNANENHTSFVPLVIMEIEKFIELCEYCNKQWLELSLDFKISVPWIEKKVRLNDADLYLQFIHKKPVYKDFIEKYNVKTIPSNEYEPLLESFSSLTT